MIQSSEFRSVPHFSMFRTERLLVVVLSVIRLPLKGKKKILLKNKLYDRDSCQKKARAGCTRHNAKLSARFLDSIDGDAYALILAFSPDSNSSLHFLSFSLASY